jgi:hypothetical protein
VYEKTIFSDDRNRLHNNFPLSFHSIAKGDNEVSGTFKQNICHHDCQTANSSVQFAFLNSTSRGSSDSVIIQKAKSLIYIMEITPT